MKVMKRILALLLIASMLFSVASCKNKKKRKETSDENEVGISNCTVTVKSPLGAPIANVMVLLYADNGENPGVCGELKTDAAGKATFDSLDSDIEYSVSILTYPSAFKAKGGMTRDDRYVLNQENVDVVLSANPDYAPSTYEVGDYMPNFTLTDINGVSYNLYDLLTEKKAVVINFWFTTCGPCASEFPALNTAYNSYKDSIAVLAVNDLASEPGNSAEDVRNYASSKGLNMPFISLHRNTTLALPRFGVSLYPTTIVIDRYGVVSILHTGAITSVSGWSNMFDYYTSENYNGIPYGL